MKIRFDRELHASRPQTTLQCRMEYTHAVAYVKWMSTKAV